MDLNRESRLTCCTKKPKKNLYRNYMTNGYRIRSLAASEPVLSPKFIHPSEPNDMTLKQRPLLYGSQLIERPHSSVQHFDDAGRNSSLSNRLAGYETNFFDNDSMSSFGEMLAYDNHCLHRSRPHHRDRLRNRFSYAEPNDDRKLLRPDNYLIEPSEHDISHNNFYRPESRQGRWHWVSPHSTFLSPSSPLDSGLSSQSITSSPSLETEPFPFQNEAFQDDGHLRCLCPKLTYPESKDHLYHLNRYDSDRISPAGGFVSLHSRISPNDRGRIPYNGKTIPYNVDEFDNNDHPFSQKRYGKLGIVGEATNTERVTMSRQRLDNFRERNYPQNYLQNKISHAYSEGNGIPLQKPQRHKSQTPVPDYTRPCVIIIESPEKSDSSSEGASSPDQDHSDKSPGIESPMSVTASNSASESPSVSSSNNELYIDKRRKSSKTTESEIRELEDMYKKCNLNDKDLLDRAERRDLPIPHQEKIGHRLTRSNSDTLYEVMSPSFHNPYETPYRAPPLRRSGLPDRIADDMALRKLQKPVSSSGFKPVDSTITYMLCSTHFTPSVPVGKDVLFKDYPDVELDDFSYRKHYFGKNKIMDPQPPFGIPLRPLPPRKVFTDYLHVDPPNVPQPLCHARKNPDVVRDDLAFRALRKEEPERIYYDVSQFYKKSKR